MPFSQPALSKRAKPQRFWAASRRGGIRRASVAALAVTSCAVVFAPGAGAKPMIFPRGELASGQTAWLEVVAPADARSCSLAFTGAEYRYGPYPVSLGGPTRVVRWKVGRNARGTWRGRLSCRAARRGRKPGKSLGTGTAKVVVGRSGAADGRFMAKPWLGVGHGSIPEMPETSPVRRAAIPNPLSNEEVNTRDPSFPFTACSNSKWMSTTRTTGEGVATLIQFEPTFGARENALANFTSPSHFLASLSESNKVYGEMWADLNRCANFTSDMTRSQRHSMYMQMACHARWGVPPRGGGNTWDLEAWRRDVDWSTGLSYGGRCGQNYGNVAGAGSYLENRIVNSIPINNIPDQKPAWLVENGVRRHIRTTKAYDCLRNAGKPAARWFPAQFIDTYLPTEGQEINDDVCPAPQPAAQPQPAPQPQPTPQPPPPPPATWAEQQGSLGANTFTNPYNASGMGQKIAPMQWVQVSCKVYAPQIASANPDGYWYRIASPPWNNAYYAVANTFWNGDIPGQKPYTHNTDFAVPNC